MITASGEVRVLAPFERYTLRHGKPEWLRTGLHPAVMEPMDDYKHDPWGSVMGALFVLCDLLHAIGYRVSDFRQSPMREEWTIDDYLTADNRSGEFDWHRDMIEAMTSGEPLTAEHMLYAVRVFTRYADLTKLAGRDY
jgi:hypothetical protein